MVDLSLRKKPLMAAATIALVLATGGDPVALGVVNSLSRPDLAEQMEDPEAHCLDACDRASIC